MLTRYCQTKVNAYIQSWTSKCKLCVVVIPRVALKPSQRCLLVTTNFYNVRVVIPLHHSKDFCCYSHCRTQTSVKNLPRNETNFWAGVLHDSQALFSVFCRCRLSLPSSRRYFVPLCFEYLEKGCSITICVNTPCYDRVLVLMELFQQCNISLA